MRDTRYEIGSALILAVVLTSLLAIVGVMFLMVARVDRIATSAISENKELNFAVETVVDQISQLLTDDVPGNIGRDEDEYYDYPGPKDKWLASLEPHEDGGYKWRQISNVTGTGVSWTNLPAEIVEDHVLNVAAGDKADADGDGVSDSVWVKLPNMNSSKGKPIFAAIRIIDNGGMINVNTIFADPNAGDKRKGDMLTDIYIDELVKAGGDQIFKFIENRSEDPTITEVAAQQYHIEVSRRVENPAASNPPYTLYDISEELSLRNRFVLFPNGTITRLEAGSAGDPDRCLSTTLRWRGYGNSYAPYTTSDFESWKRRLNPLYDANEPVKSNYDFRHLLTTYNMDRIINPSGGKMVNINRINLIDEPNITDLYNAIRMGFAGAESIAAQMAVNLKDYSDNDANVSTINVGGQPYYGFERPCIYISELAHNFVPDPNDPNIVYRSYAIELYKPYSEDAVTADWRIDVDGTSIDIDSWPQTKDFYVIQNQDPNGVAILDVNSNSAAVQDSTELVFGGNSQIRLQRFIADVNDYIVVDSDAVPSASGNWLAIDGNSHSVQRDINPHKCIRRLWDDSLSEVDSETLGSSNSYTDPSSDMIQAHPYLDPSIYENKGFKNVGEVGMVFCKSAYPESVDVIVPSDTEEDVRIDVNTPIFQQIFNYLTVFDPSSDGINNDGDRKPDWSPLIDEIDLNRTPELKIPGRININTAPWYVIAQLPWMELDIAQAVVLHRDTPGVDGFESIGELMQVAEMDYHAVNPVPLPGFPDLTPNDGVGDDFEERDVIFARISNLVTVRSDVFTAYILVRIGVDGPQKRVIAILDRSNVYSSDGKVRIVALHPVPDPR